MDVHKTLLKWQDIAEIIQLRGGSLNAEVYSYLRGKCIQKGGVTLADLFGVWP